MSSDFPIVVQFSLPFPDSKTANIVKSTVEVDEEMKANTISKTLTVVDNMLNVEIRGRIAKDVRVVTSSVLEMIQLSTKTLATFA